MDKKLMVYYDITAWERIEVEDFDDLKDRCAKICKKLGDELGIMSFTIRTGEPEEEVQIAPTGENNEQPTTN